MNAPAVLRPSQPPPALPVRGDLYGAAAGDFGRTVALARSLRLLPRAVLLVEGGSAALSPDGARALVEALTRFLADAEGV